MIKMKLPYHANYFILHICVLLLLLIDFISEITFDEQVFHLNVCFRN